MPDQRLQHWLLQREPTPEPAAPIWSDKEPEILAQDRRVLESAQRAYAREGDRFEQSVEADATTPAARRAVRLAVQGRMPEAFPGNRSPRVLS